MNRLKEILCNEEYRKNLRTPFYYYDIELLANTLDAAVDSMQGINGMIHYAVKANADSRILRIIAERGFGADCVSSGEVKLAIKAGVNPEDIVFAGVGKRDDEIEYALSTGVGCLNVESVEELEVIDDIAEKMGKIANVALRVNPDIDAHTHEYITTGLKENKFGISHGMLDMVLERCGQLKNIKIIGLHCHIGSQVTIIEPYRLLCERIKEIIPVFEHHGIHISNVNVGGGLGIDYEDPDNDPIPDFKSYFQCFREHLNLGEDVKLHFEPGRALVAQCGTLVSRVLYVKKGVGKEFVILDAGMTDLIRPALYGAHHQIDNLTAQSHESLYRYDVVGPICESSDCFGTDEMLPPVNRGDFIGLRSAGAYGSVMASQYNCRELAGVLYSDTLE